MTWRNIVMAVVGAWFMISAWALNPMHSSAYTTTAIILGLFILAGSLWALRTTAGMIWRYYLLALMGLYMGLTPFFYHFERFVGALWITMVMGFVVLAVGLWQIFAIRHASGEHEQPGRHHVA